MGQRWNDYRLFWREFRQQHHTTGAVLPSGRALARALASFVRDDAAGDGSTARRILEVGPGTGAVTSEILRAMRPDDRLDLVELNDQFVEQLRWRFAEDSNFSPMRDRVELHHASVEDVSEDQPYDLIVSGLPLNNFSVELVSRILDKLRRLLAPEGTLSFFEYVAIRRMKSVVSPAADRDRLRGISRMFDEMFSKYEVRKDLVLTNVPPAWVHHVRWGLGDGG